MGVRTCGFTSQPTIGLIGTAAAAALLGATPLAAPRAAAQQMPAASGATTARPVEPDGTINVPAFKLPPSPYISEEAKRILAPSASPAASQAAQGDRSAGGARTQAIRELSARTLGAEIAKHAATYPASRRETTIAGVRAIYFTPPNIPSRNRGKILFNIPGGGFTLGMADGTGLLESIPVAALAQVQVVSITYRQAPEFKHPAALEDIAKVYRELLKTYKPANIGLYGCSAGGTLTAEALAWFQREKLPLPGAAGILCASADASFAGDSSVWANPLQGRPSTGGRQSLAYFSEANMSDPIVSPYRSPDILRRFPPTLVVTSTRAFDLSTAVNTHRELVKAGVDADLHVWDGFVHGWFYDLDIPESREVFDVMARFFGKHLGLELKKQ